MNDYPPILKGMPDEQLWQRSSAGDREAFGCIVERYQSLVCSLAYLWILGNPVLALRRWKRG